MRVAALYDVHGNLPALEAVLAEVPDDAVILVGGDVAMGPLPRETLERLRGVGDRVQLDSRQRRPRACARRGGAGAAGRARLGARAAVGRADRVPPRAARAVGARRRRCRAACSSATRRRGTTSTSSSRERRRSASRRSSPAWRPTLVVCGHTHMQFAREIGGNQGRQRRQRRHAVRGRARRLLGAARARRSSTGERCTTRRRSKGIETPIGYFSEDRPSKAEVTEFFGTLAVGA